MKSNTNRTMVLRLRRFTQKDSPAVLTVVRTATVFLKRGSASTFVSIGRIRIPTFPTLRRNESVKILMSTTGKERGRRRNVTSSLGR
jgi:hypothetical protein